MAANASGVNLNFYYGATLPDPGKILLGSGNQNRFIRLERAADLAKPEVAALIDAATVQARTPVSYTHLDVYKRQGNLACVAPEPAESVLLQSGVDIVSVTPS